MSDLELNQNQLILTAFRSFLETTPDILFIKDTHLVYQGASKAYANLLGYQSPHELIGKTDYDLYGNRAVAERYADDDKKILASGAPLLDRVELLPTLDGTERYSSTSKHPIKDDNGTVVGLYGLGRDVTAQIELEEEKERQELSTQMFDAVLEANITKGRVIRAESILSPESMDLLRGKSLSRAVQIAAAQLIHPDHAAEFTERYTAERLQSDYANGIKEFSHLIHLNIEGKKFKWIKATTRLYISKRENDLRLISFLWNVTDEVLHKEDLEIRATTDPLTGLLNRKSTMEQINACLNAYGRKKHHALLFLDLDSFKQVNDTQGHPFGDIILREIGEKLQNFFREDDVVGRIGGDEFLILLKNVSTRVDVEKKARQIFEQLPFYCHENGIDIRVTCSVGVSMYRGDGKPLEQLYHEADQAMYLAKKGGKNQLTFYD